MQLVANFGELRPNHFHMGLDIRTQGRENLPVFAAADGYISRIKIEKYGYGKAIYVTHANGYTTLYAHLNSFYNELEEYVKNKQYKDESWEQDFDISKELFPVVKGQFIANSGNTGGSAGPHLHFEIRDTKTGNNLNPLLFGFDIADNIPPLVYGLYWYDRNYSAYTAQPQQIALTKNKSNYVTKDSVVKVGSPNIALGIRMEDLNNGSLFRYGVYHAALYVDNNFLFEYTLDNFSYDYTCYANASMDYKKWITSKQGIQYLTVLPGNKLDIFSPLKSDGRIILNDTNVHSIQIQISDEFDNADTINLLLRYDSSLHQAYSIPENVIVCDVNEINYIETSNAKISFDKNAFYDALPLNVFETNSTIAKQVSSTIHISDYTIPVHDDYRISIKSNKNLVDSLKDKVVMEMKSGNSITVIHSTENNNFFTGSFNELGDVRLLVDTIAPKIATVNFKNGTVIKAQKNLTVKCVDETSEIESFKATLDGNWLMFSKKNNYFIYSFDERCANGEHTLIITVTDVAGNALTQAFNFIKQ